MYYCYSRREKYHVCSMRGTAGMRLWQLSEIATSAVDFKQIQNNPIWGLKAQVLSKTQSL